MDNCVEFKKPHRKPKKQLGKSKKEREKARVKRILTGKSVGGILSNNKLPIILITIAMILILFLGQFLIGKIIAGALLVIAIIAVIKGRQ